ncbi:hypothetical protein BRADI_4g13857v3 [Brachypodium distachyon]|uniref:BTB domain-containing protein n=1 Tax=Brachypodium distachyon TaxID=15368 RepID=A0A0Q3H348_BRADI|nr:hypothetical protein BRADI_4g13857v3 [Brachypodium distachyon]
MSSSPLSAVLPTTASAVVTKAVAGSHVLKVKGYSLIKGLGVGKFIEFGKFSVGGSSWTVRFYPDGGPGSDYCADWVSIALFLLDPNPTTDVRANFKFNLLDQAQGKHVELNPQPGMRSFSNAKTGFGQDRFIKRMELDESTYLKDDCLEIRCDVTFALMKQISKVAVEAAKTQFVAVPPSDMHRHLAALLSGASGGGEGSVDVRFEVGGETFAAHRCLLAARSSVFSALLFGPMKEKTATCVKIEDMEPRVFKAMLHFIYTDSLPEMDKGETTVMAQHLLVAADMYNLPRLKLICEHELCKHVDGSTVDTMLALADQHGCRGLKEACLSTINFTRNLKETTASDGSEDSASAFEILAGREVTLRRGQAAVP